MTQLTGQTVNPGVLQWSSMKTAVTSSSGIRNSSVSVTEITPHDCKMHTAVKP